MARRTISTTKKQIKKYWYRRLKELGKISKIKHADFMKNDYCFACLRMDKRLDRAHIIAHFDGGLDSPKNLHLLCRGCHHQSEAYRGDSYFRWFMKQNAMHSVIYDAARFSGVAMQVIFDVFIKDRIPALADSLGFNIEVDNAEEMAAFVSLMKMMSIPSDQVQIKA